MFRSRLVRSISVVKSETNQRAIKTTSPKTENPTFSLSSQPWLSAGVSSAPFMGTNSRRTNWFFITHISLTHSLAPLGCLYRHQTDNIEVLFIRIYFKFPSWDLLARIVSSSNFEHPIDGKIFRNSRRLRFFFGSPRMQIPQTTRARKKNTQRIS